MVVVVITVVVLVVDMVVVVVVVETTVVTLGRQTINKFQLVVTGVETITVTTLTTDIIQV